MTARSMLSLGTEVFFAFWMASYRVGLPAASPPPIRAATSMFLISLANDLARRASTTAFWCLVVAHLECPDMVDEPSPTLRDAVGVHHGGVGGPVAHRLVEPERAGGAVGVDSQPGGVQAGLGEGAHRGPEQRLGDAPATPAGPDPESVGPALGEALAPPSPARTRSWWRSRPPRRSFSSSATQDQLTRDADRPQLLRPAGRVDRLRSPVVGERLVVRLADGLEQLAAQRHEPDARRWREVGGVPSNRSIMSANQRTGSSPACSYSAPDVGQLGVDGADHLQRAVLRVGRLGVPAPRPGRAATRTARARCPGDASPGCTPPVTWTRRGSTSESSGWFQPYATRVPPVSRPRMVSRVGVDVGLVELLVELVDAVPLARLVEVLDRRQQPSSAPSMSSRVIGRQTRPCWSLGRVVPCSGSPDPSVRQDARSGVVEVGRPPSAPRSAARSDASARPGRRRPSGPRSAAPATRSWRPRRSGRRRRGGSAR